MIEPPAEPEGPRRPARVQYCKTPADLDAITFEDGLAAVEVRVELLDRIPFAGEHRENGPRLRRLLRAVRREGFRPVDPIVCRIGMKGRWVIVDGGHRVTAARRVSREWWSNICTRKVRTLYFLLFTTAGSWSKVRAAAEADKQAAGPGTSPLPGATDPADRSGARAE